MAQEDAHSLTYPGEVSWVWIRARASISLSRVGIPHDCGRTPSLELLRTALAWGLHLKTSIPLRGSQPAYIIGIERSVVLIRRTTGAYFTPTSAGYPYRLVWVCSISRSLARVIPTDMYCRRKGTRSGQMLLVSRKDIRVSKHRQRLSTYQGLVTPHCMRIRSCAAAL